MKASPETTAGKRKRGAVQVRPVVDAESSRPARERRAHPSSDRSGPAPASPGRTMCAVRARAEHHLVSHEQHAVHRDRQAMAARQFQPRRGADRHRLVEQELARRAERDAVAGGQDRPRCVLPFTSTDLLDSMT